MKKKYFGVDVGSKELVLAYFPSGSSGKVRTYKNTVAGIKKLLKLVGKFENAHIILEATGTYSKRLVYGCLQADVPLSMLTPSQGKSIGLVLGKSNKTDAEDARSLARYGEMANPSVYVHPSENEEHNRQIIKYISYLNKEKTRISNKLHALSFEQYPNAYVVKELEEELIKREQQIKEAMEELENLQGDELQEAIEKAETVVGIGRKTALCLILLTGGLRDFETPKQLANFLGICPALYESGSSVRKRANISKKGNKMIRSLLYMCARSATQHNPSCKALYDRLRKKGKAHKLAMVAVGHKLVRQIFAVVKNNVDFDKQYKNEKFA